MVGGSRLSASSAGGVGVVDGEEGLQPQSLPPHQCPAQKVTVEQALKIMEQKGLNQLPVVSAPRLIVGVATLAGIRGMIGKEEISFSDQIKTAVSTNFKWVSLGTNLRTLSRILDTNHFALVVHHQKLCETL